MALDLSILNDETLKLKTKSFNSSIKSNMNNKSNYNGDSLAFDWVDEIESACPFLDIIIRNPKLILIQEANLEKTEKSKKITVESVKNLAKNTQYIDDVDEKTGEVRPSKILDIRSEETFNIYENRFLYTLFNDLVKFLRKKEKELKDFEINKEKLLEYKADTKTDTEKINITVKINSVSIPEQQDDEKLQEQLKSIKERLKRIKDYTSSWERSEMIKTLNKEHVHEIKPPLKKTNILLKNPNFKIASKLWDFIRNYDIEDNDDSKENKPNSTIEILKGFIDHSFLIDYAVLDSLTKSKREQKKKIISYSTIILAEEFNKVMKLLSSSGIKLTEEELLSIISKMLKKDNKNRLAGSEAVKNKFKNAMEEYLERTKRYL